jgi:hypothetical protein
LNKASRFPDSAITLADVVPRVICSSAVRSPTSSSSLVVRSSALLQTPSVHPACL